MIVTVGIPKALYYYRYHVLWETFFTALGCEVVYSGDSNRETLRQGETGSVDECCLPSKLYMGHIRTLQGRCDALFVPFLAAGCDGEFCPRLRGFLDSLRHSDPCLPLLWYSLDSSKGTGERDAFLRLGLSLGKSVKQSREAFRRAKLAAARYEGELQARQALALSGRGLQILLAGAPYLIHDPYTGRPVVRMVQAAGGTVLYGDRFEREACLKASRQIVPGLRLSAQRETVGAAALYARHTDGLILLGAYPCGGDALAYELLRRALPDVPLLRIILDGQESETGLLTRVESFMDIACRKHQKNGGVYAKAYHETGDNQLSAYGELRCDSRSLAGGSMS